MNFTHLQAGNKVSRLQQSQLANLINDLCNLRVQRSGSSIGGLPSPSGRPSALGQICGRRDAQGCGRADNLSAASSCGLGGDGHDGGCLAVTGGKGNNEERETFGTEALFPDIQISLRKETRTRAAGKSTAAHVTAVTSVPVILRRDSCKTVLELRYLRHADVAAVAITSSLPQVISLWRRELQVPGPLLIILLCSLSLFF